MKHAVEVEMVNGVKMISLTPMMKFLVHVAGALEHRKSANIHEIKKTLKPGTNIHERSDIELNRESALSAPGLKNILASKLISAPDTTNNNFNNDFSHELKQSLSQSLFNQNIKIYYYSFIIFSVLTLFPASSFTKYVPVTNPETSIVPSLA